jgi:hypothetical protein
MNTDTENNNKIDQLVNIAASCYGFLDKPERMSQFEEQICDMKHENQTFAITGTAHLENTEESFREMLMTHVKQKHENGYRQCMVGACSGVDVQVAHVINEFNSKINDQDEHIRLTCVNASDKNGNPDEIDESIPYVHIYNLNCHFKVRDALLMHIVDSVISAVPIPHKFWKSSTPVKSINFCKKINKEINILIFNEKDNMWSNASKDDTDELETLMN